MLLTIGIILLVAWALGLFAFHVGGIIHLLIVLAVISFIAHLFMGRRTVA
ncbi:MAG: lmo0937 family membrane protein [Acidobacteriota bacterium]